MLSCRLLVGNRGTNHPPCAGPQPSAWNRDPAAAAEKQKPRKPPDGRPPMAPVPCCHRANRPPDASAPPARFYFVPDRGHSSLGFLPASPMPFAGPTVPHSHQTPPPPSSDLSIVKPCFFIFSFSSSLFSPLLLKRGMRSGGGWALHHRP